MKTLRDEDVTFSLPYYYAVIDYSPIIARRLESDHGGVEIEQA